MKSFSSSPDVVTNLGTNHFAKLPTKQVQSRFSLRFFAGAIACVALVGCPGPTGADDAGTDSGVVDAQPDAGTPEPVDAGEVDAGERDAGTPEPPDAGQPEPRDSGSPEPVDAGEPEQDAGPGVVVDDEAGGLDDPLAVTLPFDTRVDLTPNGDMDCFAFTVETAGLLVAGTDGDNNCTGLDTIMRFYAAGETDQTNYLLTDDDNGPGPCSLIEAEIAPGSYVMCARAFSSFTTLSGIDVFATFAGYECGDGTIDPGEECDATPGCTAGCLLDDGLDREDEIGGNDTAIGAGVLDLTLDKTVRGQVAGSNDADWWRLPLPGGLNPGAVRFSIGGLDPLGTGCGTAADVRGQVFTVDDLDIEKVSSSAGAPCQVATLASIAGDVIFGNETIFIRINSTSGGGSYTLTATFIEQVCGNGELEPSEECEPNTPGDPLTDFCSAATCRYIPPSNDVCTNADDLVIPIDGSKLLVAGVNTTASNRLSPSCRGNVGSTGGRDTFYTFTAPADGTVAIDLFAFGWNGALVSVHSGACSDLTEIGCDRSSPRPSVELDVTTGETYTVSVDSTTQGGPYELQLSYLITPTNDTCATALDISSILTLDGAPHVFTGDTRAASDDATSDLDGCQVATPGEGSDTFYTFVAAQSGRMQIALSAIGWGGVAYLTAGACGATSVCGVDGDVVEAVVVLGEAYTIVVDADDDEVGPFSLSVRYVPVPANDTCAAAEEVILILGDEVSVAGDTTGALDDLDANCSSSSATSTRDTFYRMVAPEEGILDLDLDSTFDSVLVTSFDCGFGTEEFCSDGDNGRVFMAAGAELFVSVDAWTNTGFGEYVLNAMFSPTPDNNLCVNAEIVALPGDGSVVDVTGSTLAASDDYDATCSSSSANSTQDTFYEVTAPGDGTIIFDLDSSFDSVLAVSSGCDPADEFFCADGDKGSVDVTNGQTLTVAVDAWSSGKGEYTLRMAFAALPSNDTCAAATLLPLAVNGVQTVSGTNAAATDTSAAECGSTTATGTRDVFYRFVAPDTGRVLASVDSTYATDISVLDACGAATDLECLASFSSGTRSVNVDVVQGQEYIVAIDGHSGTATGFFELTLAFLSTLEGGETCQAATPLPSTSGVVAGDLDGAANDYDAEVLGDCTNFPSVGGDTVYSITLNTGDHFTASYDASTSGNDESLYLLDACPPVADSCVEGSDSSVGNGESIDFTYTGAAPKTFFIIVDEYGLAASGTGGPYTLTWNID